MSCSFWCGDWVQFDVCFVVQFQILVVLGVLDVQQMFFVVVLVYIFGDFFEWYLQDFFGVVVYEEKEIFVGV